MKKEIDNKNISFSYNFSYNEILNVLQSENADEAKSFALLSLEEIKNKNDFRLFIKHLTNHDGKLREIVSLKLVQFGNENKIDKTFLKDYFLTLLDALCDVNPNVARNIVEFIENSCRVEQNFSEKLIEKIEGILVEIEQNSKPKKWRTQKNHILNKKFFNLYWCLEALSAILNDKINNEKLIKILYICSDFFDYTIREKTAKILVKMTSVGILPPQDLLQKLKNDENYYVKLCFYAKI